MHQLAFGGSAHGRVAGLPGDAVEIEGEQSCVQAQPGGGDGRFTARMAAPHDDHVEDFGGRGAGGHSFSMKSSPAAQCLAHHSCQNGDVVEIPVGLLGGEQVFEANKVLAEQFGVLLPVAG